MLLVKTHLGPSKIHGIGLFASEFIPKGVPVWRYVEGFDRLLQPDFVAGLPEVAQLHVTHFCAYLPSMNCFLMLGDDNRFANHSDQPTCRAIVNDGLVEELVAAIDLYPGDEITENYTVYADQICGTNWAPVFRHKIDIL